MKKSLFVPTLAFLAVAPPAAAQAPAEFYKDSQIELIVASAAGDGYDLYARLLARHMGRHIPGQPTFIVKNMPAGGGRAGLNHIYNVLTRDGSAFGMTLRHVPFDPLYGVEATRVDGTRFGWIGSINSEVSLCIVWHDKAIRSIDDARRREVLMGSAGPSVSDSTHARLLNRVAGTKLKVVLGYPSSNAVHIALERGEVEGRCGLSYDSLAVRLPHWVADKKVHILAQFAASKHPALADVPFIMDLAANDEDRQVAQLMVGANEMGRPFLAPPDVPPDRLALLRRAFDAATKDPQLLADAAKQGMQVRLVTGEAIEALVKQIYATPRHLVAIAKKLVEPD